MEAQRAVRPALIQLVSCGVAALARRAVELRVVLLCALLCGASGCSDPVDPDHAETGAPIGWDAALDAAFDDLDVGAPQISETQAALVSSVRTPRTQRLMSAERLPSFTTKQIAPIPLKPRRVPFTKSFGVKKEGKRLTIRPAGALMSAADLGIPMRDFAEVLARVRITQGTTLQFLFHPRKGDRIAQVSLPVSPSGEWQTLRITNPLLMHQAREDHIDRITLRGDADVEETLLIELEPLTITPPGAVYSLSTSGWRNVDVHDDLRPSYWQSVAGEVRMDLPKNPGGRLRGSVALLHPSGARHAHAEEHANATSDATPLQLDVIAEWTDGRHQSLRSLEVPADQPWLDFAVDLPSGAHPSAILLRTAQLPKSAVLLHANWRKIDISRAPQRVVLLVMDTLRADALGCYGSSNATPTLDALAQQGVRFARCYSQAHWTRPSMPSIMTGLYSSATGVENKFDQLPEVYDTLAERFAQAGFYTAGFISNAQAGPTAGLGQGYDRLTMFLGQDSDQQLREEVEPSLAALVDDDLLLYVHLMEAHGPHGPELHEQVSGPQPGTALEHDGRYDRYWLEQPTDQTRRRYYDSDVESMDRALGGFFERVIEPWEATGEPVIVAALSDHGEYLGEDGLWGHGKGLLRAEVVHTPLILRAPGRLEAGHVWPDPVENIDVGVSLLELAGVPLESGAADRGRSLLRALELGESSRVALSTNVSGNRREFTLWGPKGALLGVDDELTARYNAAFEFAPAEDHLRAHAERWAQLWAALRERGEVVRVFHWSQASESISNLDAASLEQLKALGYLGY